MLVSLLPGLRDLRTPLAVGYLWLLCLWLWWGDTLLTLKQQSNAESGPIHSIVELSGALGAGVVLSAVSFVAYLLGTMLLWVFRWNVLSARRSAFQVDRLTFIISWFEFAPLRIHSQPIDRLKQQVQESVRARWPDLGSGSITSLVTTVCDQLDAVGIRLQAFDKEMWDTFDRSKAESEFRSGLMAPLTFVSIIATAKLGVLWLLLLIVPFWLSVLWAQKAIDATATLVQAVTLKIVNPPVFDRTHLAEIVEQLNTLFDDTAFTDADRVAIYNHILGKVAENEDLQEQAKANNAEQFADSPDLIKALLAAVVDAMTNHGAMSEKLLTDEHARADFIRLVVPDLYERMNQQAA